MHCYFPLLSFTGKKNHAVAAGWRRNRSLFFFQSSWNSSSAPWMRVVILREQEQRLQCWEDTLFLMMLGIVYTSVYEAKLQSLRKSRAGFQTPIVDPRAYLDSIMLLCLLQDWSVSHFWEIYHSDTMHCKCISSPLPSGSIFRARDLIAYAARNYFLIMVCNARQGHLILAAHQIHLWDHKTLETQPLFAENVNV